MPIAPRHSAAVTALALAGTEAVLEIGCGHGVAVRLVLDQLTSGTIMALDRSAKMIDMVEAGNAEALSSGRLVTRAVALEDADFAGTTFDAMWISTCGWVRAGRLCCKACCGPAAVSCSPSIRRPAAARAMPLPRARSTGWRRQVSAPSCCRLTARLRLSAPSKTGLIFPYPFRPSLPRCRSGGEA